VHALQQGLARAAAAPAVLAGAIAVLWWLSGASDTRNAIAAFLLWAFLSGGILDRYARLRPTRSRGFFGACGAHFAAMARLGLIVILVTAGIHWTLASRVANPFVMTLAIVLLAAVTLAAVYGQIRLVVEDRRSAAGALMAGARFVRRNPASIGIYLLYALLIWAATWTIAAVGTDAGGAWGAGLAATARIVVTAYLVLALYASGVSLFQSRLAHAGYTAAPALVWPESPAAEAIANGAGAAP
jgi:hypothetical protein